MIHGSGLPANSHRGINSPVVAYFAAGAFNSVRATESGYRREINDIYSFMKNIENKIRYFSIFVAIDGAIHYGVHKPETEKIIIRNENKFA